VLAAVLSAFTLGGALGLLVLPRILARVEPRRVLAFACVGCAACYAGWMSAGSALEAVVWMFFVGMLASAQCPIATAQAYRALPERSGLVVAAGQLFVPFDAGMVLVLGLVADQFGIALALAALVIQPLGLLCVTLVARPPGGARAPGAGSPLDDETSGQ
jgi:fucose permease